MMYVGSDVFRTIRLFLARDLDIGACQALFLVANKSGVSRRRLLGLLGNVVDEKYQSDTQLSFGFQRAASTSELK